MATAFCTCEDNRGPDLILNVVNVMDNTNIWRATHRSWNERSDSAANQAVWEACRQRQANAVNCNASAKLADTVSVCGCFDNRGPDLVLLTFDFAQGKITQSRTIKQWNDRDTLEATNAVWAECRAWQETAEMCRLK